ncbi:hypothetical protein Trydic_g13236 [Trypoxylus dichotomus]
MTLQHSKTWPVNSVAVVQLRVDSNGRAYSAFMGQDVSSTNSRPPQSVEDNKPKTETTTSHAEDLNTSVCDDDDDEILPMFKQHLQLFSTMYKPVRTDTVSTIVEQELESEGGIHNSNGVESVEIDAVNHLSDEKIRPYDKIQVLALTRIEEVSDESDTRANFHRRPSIKIDNWDLIYSESNKSHCPKHPNSDTIVANANHTCGCKSKNIGRCNEHTDCLLPEIPLDARKVTTLRRHYYPEGGWGWVIVVCSVLVHVLNNGLQLSCSQLVLPAAGKFKTLPVHVAADYPMSFDLLQGFVIVALLLPKICN